MSISINTDIKKTETILIVDDSPTNIQILLETLKTTEYHLLIAKNGESAIRIAENTKPSLILLDIMMPHINGYQVCETLKTNEITKKIPIIFLSALQETKDKVKGLNLGAVDFISKPFQIDEVIARVNTQLKIYRLERELSKKNQQLTANKEQILENMYEGVLGFDKIGNIQFANKAASKLLDTPINNILSKNIFSNFFDELNNDVKSSIIQPIQDVFTEQKTQSIEDAPFLKQNGTPFSAAYSCTPILIKDNFTGAVLVFRDITERKKNQQALKNALNEIEQQKETLTHVSRLSMMGEMSAGFAHEVNQPLTAIANYSQVAKRIIEKMNNQNPSFITLKETMSKINTQATRAGEIISRIRSFVKKPEHKLERYNLKKLMLDTVKLAEVDSKNNGIKIQLNVEDNLPDTYIDAIQIQQVILNLIRNGMEAMKNLDSNKEGITVEVKMTENEFIKISVIDKGCGLAKNAEEKLFMPFYSTKNEGVGIGLSICYSIIQAHGGIMHYHRRDKGGTIFEFTVPISIDL